MNSLKSPWIKELTRLQNHIMFVLYDIYSLKDKFVYKTLAQQTVGYLLLLIPYTEEHR